MNKNPVCRVLVLCVCLLGHTIGWAQKRAPDFKDYPVKEIYTGKNVPVALGKQDLMFRTRLKNAAKEKPNFAGHYILTSWGCGAACLMGAAIDATTGKVHSWGFSVCCWEETPDNFKPIDFRLDSALVVFSGLRNEEGSKGPH